MPTPLGHALGAMAVGWLICPRLGKESYAFSKPPMAIGPTALAGIAYAAVGLAPDLDLLVGAHSTYTHSVGAVGLVFLAAFAASKRPRAAAAVAAAWASHLLLDWLGSDT